MAITVVDLDSPDLDSPDAFSGFSTPREAHAAAARSGLKNYELWEGVELLERVGAYAYPMTKQTKSEQDFYQSAIDESDRLQERVAEDVQYIIDAVIEMTKTDAATLHELRIMIEQIKAKS
jgi:hypothetical protein